MGSSKKATVGYRYSMTLHMGVCHRPDALLELRSGGRQFYLGEVTTNTTLAISAPDLFGGDEKEGGLAGNLDVMLGDSEQLANGWLSVLQGGLQPGYRGFLSLVYNGQVSANNPYIKPWSVRVRSITEGWTGGSCWYPEKASIPVASTTVPAPEPVAGYFQVEAGSYYTLQDGVTNYGVVPTTYVADADTIAQNCINARNTSQGTSYVLAGSQMTAITSGPNQGPAIVAWELGHGPTVGIAAVRVTPVCPTPEHVVSYVDHGDIIDSIDSPTVLCSLPSTEMTRQAMNPAHIIYQCLTDTEWGMGYPRETIDDASFRAAADTLYAEGLGLCFKWNNQATIQDFTQTVADHAGLAFGQDRRTGLFRMLLLRDDYNIDDLPVFTQKDAKVIRYQRPAMADTVNEVLVDFIDTITGEDATTPPAQNLANIQGQGRVVSVKLNFSGLPIMALGQRIAMRELKARSTPLWQLQLEFQRQAYDLFPGEPFVMDLLDHPIGAKLVLRAGELDLGNTADGTIRVDAVEDAFGMPLATYTGDPGNGGALPSNTPLAATSMAFEAPYVELAQAMTAPQLAALPADAGYLGATGVRPTSSSINYQLWTSLDGGAYAQASAGDFAPSGLLAVAANPDDLELTLSDAVDLSLLEVGTAAFLGEHPDAELVRIDAVDTTTGIVTVGRGCGDTVPGGGNATRVWPIGTRLWGYDIYAAADVQQYIAGETVAAKLLTHTGAGNLALASAPVASVTMASRQARPYPPGLVTIDGVDARTATSVSDANFPVTWAHRDRALQADTLVDYTAADIGPDPTTRYTLRFRRADTNALLVEATAIANDAVTANLNYAGQVVMELYAVNDAGDSWQRHRFTFDHPVAHSPTLIIGGTAWTAPVTIIDGGGA